MRNFRMPELLARTVTLLKNSIVDDDGAAKGVCVRAFTHSVTVLLYNKASCHTVDAFILRHHGTRII